MMQLDYINKNRAISQAKWEIPVWKNFMRFIIFGLLVTHFLCGSSLNTNAESLVFIEDATILANPNPNVPLAAVLQFELNQPAHVLVSIENDQFQHALSFAPSRNPTKGLPIIGMHAGKEHTIQVIAHTPGNRETLLSEKLKYTPPPLSNGPLEFPTIEVNQKQPDKISPGFTIFNPRLRIRPGTFEGERESLNQSFGMLAAVDHAGEVVWYYKGDSRISDYELLDNGHIIFLTADYRAIEIDMLGNTIRQWYAKNRPYGPLENAVAVDTLTFHHDIEQLPNGNFLVLGSERRLIEDYYTSEYDPDAPRADQWVMGDEILEFTPEGGIVWRWKAFDHMPAERIGYETFRGYWKRRGFPDTIDWSHANAILYFEEGENIWINFRYQSAILNIDQKTGGIIWIAGEPSGWGQELGPKLLKLKKGERWFWHQHAPMLTPHGTLLLFDNSNYLSRPFEPPIEPENTHSQAVEYELDIENMEIRPLWGTNDAQDVKILSFAMGSVQWLPNQKNVLVGYGFVMEQDGLEDVQWRNIIQHEVWTCVREYTHTQPAELLWQLELRGAKEGIGWTIYGAQRIKGFKP